MRNSNASRRRWIGGLLLLLVVPAVVTWRRRTSTIPPEPSPRVAQPTTPERTTFRRVRDVDAPAVDATNAAPSSTAPVAPTTKPAVEPGVRISVRVLRADGAPAADVPVVALEHEQYRDSYGAAEPPPKSERARGVTDSDGRAELATTPGALWGGRIVAWEGDDAAASEKSLYAKAGDAAGVELRLARRFRVRGTVVDSAGRRVEDARVRMIVADVLSTHTSSFGPYGFAVEPVVLDRGRFEFAPVAQEELSTGFVLDVRAEGFLVQVFAFEDDVARRGELSLRLQRPRTVRGRVVSTDRSPVAGAQVSADAGATPLGLGDWSRKPAQSTTDDDGRFALAGLAEDTRDLRIVAAGFAPRTARAEASTTSDFDVGDVVLHGGDTIRGDVVDADGRAVAAAHVYWSAADAAVHGETVADADGRFVLEHVAAGPLRLYVSDTGCTMDWYESATSVDGVTSAGSPRHVVLTGARLLRIDIDYERGSELPDDPPYHHVVATSSVDGRSVLDAWPRKRSSVRYKFDAAGAYDLVVELAGYETVRRRVEISDAHETRVAVRMRRSSN